MLSFSARYMYYSVCAPWPAIYRYLQYTTTVTGLVLCGYSDYFFVKSDFGP